MTTLITKDNLAANTITAEKIASTVVLGGPKISSITYPGNDTAANPDGGQSITVNGTGFVTGAAIHVDGTIVSPVTFNSANSLTFTAPAKAANSYILYVINPDGGTAIAIPGLTYSGVPTWTTSAGSLGAPYEANSFSITLQATSDSNVTFSMSAGNTLPSGLSLAANGLLSGTIPATEANTTYTFYVDAIDAQNQETSRTFSVTYTRDTVTWSSPANGAAYSFNTGAANTISLEANSAAGRSITYSVQSGSLPANVSISGANITGTPNTGQNNTSVVIRATAASTNRFADRTLWFTISAGPSVIGEAYGGGYYAGQVSYSNNGVATHYLIVSPKNGGYAYREWSTSNTLVSALSKVDGYNNTQQLISVLPASPISIFVSNANSTALGGYNDWYLPAINELDILYYYLKPNNFNNNVSYGDSGINTHAVPPRLSQWAAGGPPVRSTASIFHEDAAQAFDGGIPRWWSSTENENNPTATVWAMNMAFGYRGDVAYKIDGGALRLIRKVPV